MVLQLVRMNERIIVIVYTKHSFLQIINPLFCLMNISCPKQNRCYIYKILRFREAEMVMFRFMNKLFQESDYKT